MSQTDKLMASGKQIGSAFVSGTIINNVGAGLVNIEARFPGRRSLELQGATGASGNTNRHAIIGGTGVFTTARGWALSHKNHVTVTFR